MHTGTHVIVSIFCQHTSGSVLAWANWHAPGNVWACLGHSTGQEIFSIVHLNGGKAGIHLDTCCVLPTVIYQ